MIPNILTTVRLFLVPLFAYNLVIVKKPIAALLIFLLSGATDVLDGFIARKFNMVTKIGKVYDPLVDKLMQITAIICLAKEGFIPEWVIWFILFKEGTMIVGGIFLYCHNVIIQSDWYGKGATVSFYTIIFFIIMFPAMNRVLKNILLVLLVVILIFAAFGYLTKLLKAFGDKENEKLQI